MSKFEEVLIKINDLRYKNPLFFTNAYFGTKELIQLLEHSTTEIFENENYVGVRFEDNGVYRLYIYAKSAETAANFLLPQKQKTTIFEIIEQKNNGDVTNLFVSYGWQVYSRLTQMSYVLGEYTSSIVDSPVEVASPSDTDSVYQLLYNTFDVNISHLPNKNQLLDSIVNNETLVIRDQGKVVAVAMFQVTGKKTKQFYQLAADPIYRGKIIPTLAFTEFEFLRSSKATVYSLWIITNNPLIKLHKLIGFKECDRYLSIFSIGGSK